MDEVENPALPPADGASPTIPTAGEEAGDPSVELLEADQPPLDVVEAEGILAPTPADSSEPSTALNSDTENNEPPANPSTALQDPPAPPPQLPEQAPELNQEAPDSLTLADLRRLRATFPESKLPPTKQLLDFGQIYDFEYQDAQSFPVELEEWFTYSEDEEVKLRRCNQSFNDDWRATEMGRSRDWTDATEEERRKFIGECLGKLRPLGGGDEKVAELALLNLTYIALGAWEETAGKAGAVELKEMFLGGMEGGGRLGEFEASSLQLQWTVAMVDSIRACNGLEKLFELLQRVFEEETAFVTPEPPPGPDGQQRKEDESVTLWCLLTLFYIFIETARTATGESGEALRTELLALEPGILKCFTRMVADLRWDEWAPVPVTKMLLLAWKTVLLALGGIKDVENVKASLRKEDEEKDKHGQPIITASPLDYNLFRQEISSKYPAYQPPAPIFPIEPENNSILPPLKHRRPSYASSDSAANSAPSNSTQSILHQPVHIATPAPSPPPSPAGPGKAGKKQNYQTNQMFPFLYPPLDSSSNDLGGKGSTELQDALVGRKWTGSDIPASILEAAELFAKRMRATRAMKQLWEARVEYMKFERGWKGAIEDENADVDEGEDDFELVSKPRPEETAEQGEPIGQTPEEKKLATVNAFYRDSLPYLQSLVIVLLRQVLHNVSDLVNRTTGQNGLQAPINSNDGPNGMANGSTKPVENGHTNGEPMEHTAEELDKLRSQEIAGKAVSATLILLLKWFKVSHILQYEYLTQLLLDSNYVPLVLKTWQSQEIGRACHYRTEREELNFFRFCQTNSRQGPPQPRQNPASTTVPQPPQPESPDSAAPPPIKLSRDSPPGSPQSPSDPFSQPPEVDELGYPLKPPPSTPLTTYSHRNIFTSINYLRVLQKLTRRKTHRTLLLVSYKSSQHLKKTLRVPVNLLRYYTLKLYKSQVPFCGRKWRQSNMKIITAVWLSVPAELRDDWLSGGGGGMGGQGTGDVDGTVEDALGLEQGIRSLAFWYNVRNFGREMGVKRDEVEAEGEGFFARELERMGVLDQVAVLREELAEGDVRERGMGLGGRPSGAEVVGEEGWGVGGVGGGEGY
ncbi:hypothetical protein MBLNU230_g5822t1 [Neophaeotheca triangularis]